MRSVFYVPYLNSVIWPILENSSIEFSKKIYILGKHNLKIEDWKIPWQSQLVIFIAHAMDCFGFDIEKPCAVNFK